MDPFVPNGVYEICNVQFSNQAAELAGGYPMGPIIGADADGNPNQLWKITNVGFGGNQIIIESVSAPKTYANAQQFQGAGLAGSRAMTVWTVVKVDNGFYLQSPDANFVWQLPNQYNAIILVNHTGENNTKWGFNLINQ